MRGIERGVIVCMELFHHFNPLADCKVGGWFVSSVVGVACNSSPTVRRSNSGKQVYAAHVRWRVGQGLPCLHV